MTPKIANRLLTQNKKRIARSIPKEWMPIRPKRLGCGGFGCVFSTRSPGVVCKITKDAAEARIVKKILDENLALEGFVRYYKIIDLRPKGLYAIWREEVSEMGEMFGFDQSKKLFSKFETLTVNISNLFTSRAWKQDFINSIAPYLKWAREKDITYEQVKTYAMEHGLSAQEKLAVLINLYESQALHMMNYDECGDIGYTLLELADKGIILTDVLMRNLGVVQRDGKEILVIADPSMPVFMF